MTRRPREKRALAKLLPPASVVAAAFKARRAVGRVHGRMLPPAATILERLGGMEEVRLLAVVTELGVPDALRDAPLSSDALASTVGADPDALARVMRFLVGRGFFQRGRDGRLDNNPVTDLLRRDHPDSLRDWTLFVGSAWHGTIWTRADHAVRTGKSATEAALGVPFFDYVQRENPEAGLVFDGAMAAGSKLQAELLLREYDFSGVSSVCDVGGGTGSVIGEVLRRNPNVRGTLFDLPEVIAKVSGELDGVGDRCSKLGGDFFAEVPAGHDRYLLLAIVHDWGDEEAVTILSNVRRAMASGARAIVVDSVIPGHDGDDFAKHFDVLMLILTGSGRERTAEQFRALFTRAGLRVSRDIILPNLIHAFELEAT